MPAPTHQPPPDVDPADRALIFAPVQFRNLSVKNRLFRSSISGRIDNYNGTGTLARLNFEERFARGGVSAIISSHVPIDVRGRVLPNYATIDHDDRIPFWRAVGERVHRHDCKFILQLSYAGRQQDIKGIENLRRLPLGATARPASTASNCTRAMDTCSPSSSARRSTIAKMNTAGRWKTAPAFSSRSSKRSATRSVPTSSSWPSSARWTTTTPSRFGRSAATRCLTACRS
jgi:2,4-dienoyl-CoA reductase-like NADH-dependent reductase (Old Yellow Enzyme family)